MIMHGDAIEVDLPAPYRITEARWIRPKAHASLEAWEKYRDNEPLRAVL